MTETTPELELVKATLIQAKGYYVRGPSDEEIEDYKKVCIENAVAWVESNADEPYSFVWCCTVLGLDPEYTRKQLKIQRRAKNP